ncbi:MAG: hypothetical protein IIB95_09120 [Candidatus Marinimicrobia bacterium]|nr:hypothetical protein [Candidatus Neomarinimicrobiota bacterium]MCH7763888.1 hypothetical protein [Candidatus Neomarinimicrobiota bacterium]
MCEEKRSKIRLIPAPVRPLLFIPIGEGGRPHLFNPIVAGGKAGNVVNSGAMDKFSPAPYGGTTVSGNEKQADFALFNLSAVGT